MPSTKSASKPSVKPVVASTTNTPSDLLVNYSALRNSFYDAACQIQLCDPKILNVDTKANIMYSSFMKHVSKIFNSRQLTFDMDGASVNQAPLQVPQQRDEDTDSDEDDEREQAPPAKNSRKRKQPEGPYYPTAYRLYVNDEMEKERAEGNIISAREINSIINPRWRTISAEEKAVYEERAKAKKAEIDIEVANGTYVRPVRKPTKRRAPVQRQQEESEVDENPVNHDAADEEEQHHDDEFEREVDEANEVNEDLDTQEQDDEEEAPTQAYDFVDDRSSRVATRTASVTAPAPVAAPKVAARRPTRAAK